jgi:ubiquinone/menaquinone biosynthesis C-methylase UbiE
MTYSAEQHFHFQVAEYDRIIRTLIPHYETMHAMIVRWCSHVLSTQRGDTGADHPPRITVIDLGGGTGSLTAAVAEQFPNADIEAWDIDAKMMEVGRHRLAKYGSRVRMIERSFEEPLPACDAVVACIALHHIRDLDRKTRVYSNIFQALRSPGIFANGDATMSSDPRTQEATYRFWMEFMMSNGITEEEARQHFVNWRDEDRYFSLEEEFEALKAAGFAQPECFWRYGPMAVYGGVK